MLEFSNIKVYDLKESVIASRNAMRIEMPSYTEEEFTIALQRAKILAKCGGGQSAGFLRQHRCASKDPFGGLFYYIFSCFMCQLLPFQNFTFFAGIRKTERSHRETLRN